MAMLASKSFQSPLGTQSSGMMASASQAAYQPTRRAPATQMATQNYASPTESEFDDLDGPDAVKNWDEDSVCEYLRSVKCGEYEKIFRKNHINGENLLEIDKEVLKEMGIEKVGDRVRLFLGIKKLRTKTYANQRRRNRSSMDGSLMAALPPGQDVIRVISTGGVTKVVKIADCNTCEEVMRVTLRKFALREDHERNYCFWVLNGVDPDPNQCRRLGDTELWRVIKDHTRPERNRLILRRVPAGEPGESELERAAAIAMEEVAQNHNRALETMDKRSQIKAQKVLGEKWESMQPPLSPVSYQDRERNVYNAARDLERPVIETARAIPRRKGMLRQFGGLRPPSELIASDLTSYFPDHSREAIDRTARMSMRRSQRLSRVNHRLSVASTLSFASSIQDAPPIPTIADSWLTASNQIAKLRPREPRFPHGYRDSVASSVLDTLQEESSPIEPNRKSYVSFADSGSDTAALSITDPDGNVVRHSYFDGSTTGSGGSLQDVNHALTEDGEDADEELQSFLAGESWDDSKWMKGALIGQGSFGSVYLALHAVTGELLAVKQVETPSPGANSQSDARKKSMIEALKREISLLRDLRHPNIVQYLGCGSSAEYLNIFLEYVPGGSVQTMLNSYGALPEPLVRSFVRQILNGLSYLHNRDIIHRDIKGANILVDNKGTIKISDFGISKKLEATNILNGANNNKHRPSLQGSVFWMAPEVVKQTSYTRKADIWSLGCLVVEMMTGQHPFPDCTQLQAIFKIGGAKATPTIPDHASEEAQEFLARTFEIDHNMRPSADELVESPFLTPNA
ncbi:ATP binding [Collariella sp. IMI 366227]|nr:ATP binding [Collariella sp. IMI 366227]